MLSAGVFGEKSTDRPGSYSGSNMFLASQTVYALIDSDMKTFKGSLEGINDAVVNKKKQRRVVLLSAASLHSSFAFTLNQSVVCLSFCHKTNPVVALFVSPLCRLIHFWVTSVFVFPFFFLLSSLFHLLISFELGIPSPYLCLSPPPSHPSVSN